MQEFLLRFEAHLGVTDAGWEVFEGPYELAGVIRLLLKRGGWLLGLDAFATADGDPRLRLWGQRSGQVEVLELDELAASADSLDAALDEIATFEAPTDTTIELLGSTADVIENPRAAVARVVDLLLTLTARSTETSALLLRSGAPRRFESALAELLSDLAALPNWGTEESTPGAVAEEAIRYLLAGELSVAGRPLSDSSGHDALRRLADPLLVRVLNNPILSEQRESLSLQVLLERIAQGPIAEGLRQLRTLGRWVAKHEDGVEQLLLPALGDESWLISDVERGLYLDLAEGLLTLRQAPYLATTSSDPLNRVVTRAVYWFGTRQSLNTDVTEVADAAINRFRDEIDRLTITRELRTHQEVLWFDDAEMHMAAPWRVQRVYRDRARWRGLAPANADYSVLIEQLRTVAGTVAHRTAASLVADASAASHVQAALVGDTLSRYAVVDDALLQ